MLLRQHSFFLCSSQLALRVKHNSYALIFGFNTFLALILFTIFTVVLSDEHGLHLGIREQVTALQGIGQRRVHVRG